MLYLGLIQSLFEGAMYTFVLEWTPALTPQKDEDNQPIIPHGYIFAAFMVGPTQIIYCLKPNNAELWRQKVFF